MGFNSTYPEICDVKKAVWAEKCGVFFFLLVYFFFCNASDVEFVVFFVFFLKKRGAIIFGREKRGTRTLSTEPDSINVCPFFFLFSERREKAFLFLFLFF